MTELKNIYKENYVSPKSACRNDNDGKNFAEYCEQWIRINEHRLKRSTLAKYDSMLEKHIAPSLGYRCCAELSSDMIAEFSNELLNKKHLAEKTVRDILTFVHEIIVYIRDDGASRLQRITISYPRAAQKELRVLSPDEQRRLTEYVSRDLDIYRLSVLLALFTGLRVGEICGLKWKYVSTESGFLTVKHTVQRIKNPDKDSGKKTVLHIGTPKTASSVRTIPLTEWMIRLFKNFIINDPDAFVITGSKYPADPRRLQRKLKKYTSDTGLDNVHFHTLRHTFATRCIELGCDTKTLSEILGHSNISTTMNRYVHPSMDFKRKNMQKLEQAGLIPFIQEL